MTVRIKISPSDAAKEAIAAYLMGPVARLTSSQQPLGGFVPVREDFHGRASIPGHDHNEFDVSEQMRRCKDGNSHSWRKIGGDEGLSKSVKFQGGAGHEGGGSGKVNEDICDAGVRTQACEGLAREFVILPAGFATEGGSLFSCAVQFSKEI